jgi:uncharacterized protein YjbI with pentapeptide repeats
MFPMEACSVPGCRNLAVFRRPTCLQHDPEPAALQREIESFLRSTEPLADLTLDHIELDELDLTRKRIHFCSLSHARLRRIRFDECNLRLVFLDFAVLEECSFAGAKAYGLVLGGASIISSSFTGAEMLRSNFTGLQARQVAFDGSDLYGSRFTGSKLQAVTFRDCNLKRVRFERCSLDGVDFRSSNTEEAFFA